MFKSFVIFLLISSPAYSQEISYTNFRNSVFVSKNADSLFFKSDTVKLILISGKPKMDIVIHFDTTDYVELGFKNCSKLTFSNHRVESWDHFTLKGKYSWNYQKKSRELNLFFQRKKFLSFKVISERDIKVNAVIGTQPQVETKEITLVKLFP